MSKSDTSETEKQYTPDYDEDADHVIVRRNTGRDVHHRPREGEPLRPACEMGDGYEHTSWRRAQPDTFGTELCGHCQGKTRVPNPGSSMRSKLLAADPEDFGLGPWPPEEPLPDPEPLPEDEVEKLNGGGE